jgi:short-subunit dehydrogenase
MTSAFPPAPSQDFRERYGQWAILAGGSEGVGAAAADMIATRGVNLLVIARDPAKLEALAADIRSRHTAQIRTMSQDLTAPDAGARVLAAAEDLEVGMLFYNAGAVGDSNLFIDQPLSLPLRMIALNCTTPTVLLHGLAPAMKARGRGALIVVGSTGSFCGGPYTAAYSASKAYQVNLMESLWAELKDDGVDVLEAVIGSTSTPQRLRNLGVKANPEMDSTPEEVAAGIIARIADGPTQVFTKGAAGTGPLIKPWSDFRHFAVNHMIGAHKLFKARTHAGAD